MKICILGSSGMLGHAVAKEFINKKNFDIYLTYNNENNYNFDIEDNKIFKFNAINDLELLKEYNFDIIINCIGIVKPRIIDSNQETTAILVNSIFPRKLANLFSNTNTKIFQIATDCVYSGKKGKYLEDDFHDANDLYGMSKSLGEVKNENFYNLRCSIIGRELNNKYSLIEWFINSNTDDLNGFSNHLWNGISTKAYAKYIMSILINKIEIPRLLHIIPADEVSKFDMLEIFNEKYFEGKKNIIPTNAKESIDRTLDSCFKELNNDIWNRTDFQKTPSIKEIISDI